MSFVPLPCSFIAVGATVTKEPASFAADDTSSNTSHVGDLRQPTADTALTVSLQSNVIIWKWLRAHFPLTLRLLIPSHHLPPTPPPSLPPFLPLADLQHTDQQFETCARHHHSTLYIARWKRICCHAFPLLCCVSRSSVCDGTRVGRSSRRFGSGQGA